jgi:hypothetical protein
VRHACACGKIGEPCPVGVDVLEDGMVRGVEVVESGPGQILGEFGDHETRGLPEEADKSGDWLSLDF